MDTLRHPLFILCFVLWLANQLLEQNHIYIRPLYAYLDDLLCLPLILTFILAVQRAYFGDKRMTIPAAHTLLAVVAISVCFEGILPCFSEVYTADAWDVLAYTSGALLFHLFLNKPLKEPAAEANG